MMISRTPRSSPRLRPPPRPRHRCQASQPLLLAANVSATRSRGNGSGSATTGIPGLADQNQNATTGTLTGTAIAIDNGRPTTGLALGLCPAWTSQPGYLDLMNALMSFLVNISTLRCVVTDCFFFFYFFLSSPLPGFSSSQHNALIHGWTRDRRCHRPSVQVASRDLWKSWPPGFRSAIRHTSGRFCPLDIPARQDFRTEWTALLMPALFELALVD